MTSNNYAISDHRVKRVLSLAQHGIAASGRSGLNVWTPVPEEGSVVTSMAAAGWAIRAGERHRLHSPPAVRVTSATLPPSEATQSVCPWPLCLCEVNSLAGLYRRART